jgi:hypothetical protein
MDPIDMVHPEMCLRFGCDVLFSDNPVLPWFEVKLARRVALSHD